jgi:hypothetical protein
MSAHTDNERKLKRMPSLSLYRIVPASVSRPPVKANGQEDTDMRQAHKRSSGDFSER